MSAAQGEWVAVVGGKRPDLHRDDMIYLWFSMDDEPMNITYRARHADGCWESIRAYRTYRLATPAAAVEPKFQGCDPCVHVPCAAKDICRAQHECGKPTLQQEAAPETSTAPKRLRNKFGLKESAALSAPRVHLDFPVNAMREWK